MHTWTRSEWVKWWGDGIFYGASWLRRTSANAREVRGMSKRRGKNRPPKLGPSPPKPTVFVRACDGCERFKPVSDLNRVEDGVHGTLHLCDGCRNVHSELRQS